MADKKTAPTFTIAAVQTGVAMPEIKSKRGSTSKFPFDALTGVGMSFGIVGRTAKSMSSIISAQNRKGAVPKKDANGNVIFKTKKVKGQDGVTMSLPTNKPEMTFGATYAAQDVDPKTDPDKATVRIWRTA